MKIEIVFIMEFSTTFFTLKGLSHVLLLMVCQLVLGVEPSGAESTHVRRTTCVPVHVCTELLLFFEFLFTDLTAEMKYIEDLIIGPDKEILAA